MADYLLIESRDPYSSSDVSFVYETATNLKKQGNGVTIFLVQNGVLPARKSPKSEPLTALAHAGVVILADDFSLQERGIPAQHLAEGVQVASIDVVVDRLAAGAKALWH